MSSWRTVRGTTVRRVLGGRSNAFLVSANSRSLLVDTGTRRHWRNLERKLNSLSSTTGTPAALILTHVHYDHAANAAMIRKTYGAKIIVSGREAHLLESGKNASVEGAVPATRFLYRIVKRFNLMERLHFEPCGYDIAVRDRYDLKEFGFNATIVPTPGHTAGSMSVIVDDEIALAGDALFGVFHNSVLPPWAADREEMIRSWKILLDTGCTLYLPSHGKPRDRRTLLEQYERHALRPA